MAYDGFIAKMHGESYGGSSTYTVITDTQTFTFELYNQNSGGVRTTMTIPFMKGDKIYSNATNSVSVRYYKFRDYSNRAV